MLGVRRTQGARTHLPKLGAEIIAPKRRIVGAQRNLVDGPRVPPPVTRGPLTWPAHVVSRVVPAFAVQSSGPTYVIRPRSAVYRTP